MSSAARHVANRAHRFPASEASLPVRRCAANSTSDAPRAAPPPPSPNGLPRSERAASSLPSLRAGLKSRPLSRSISPVGYSRPGAISYSMLLMQVPMPNTHAKHTMHRKAYFLFMGTSSVSLYLAHQGPLSAEHLRLARVGSDEERCGQTQDGRLTPTGQETKDHADR